MSTEELYSLVRLMGRPAAEWAAGRRDGRAVRVVSLNCCLGNTEAVRELIAYEPDIVLLQESPAEEQLEELADELFGEEYGMLVGYDTSILARGQVEELGGGSSSHFVRAAVKLPSGLDIRVVSLRLNPPVSRLDFWNAGFWNAHRDNRLRHRAEINEVGQSIGRSFMGHVIVGGDFNAPPRDVALSLLPASLRDTFRGAGRGWGNTGTNDFPLFRVDQIWASRGFRPVAVTAQKTDHSDHRAVVCDLVVKE